MHHWTWFIDISLKIIITIRPPAILIWDLTITRLFSPDRWHFFWSFNCAEIIFKVNNQSPLCVIFNLQTVTQALHNPWFITGLLICWFSSLLHTEAVHDCSFPLDYTQHVEEQWYEIILHNNRTIPQSKIGDRLKINVQSKPDSVGNNWNSFTKVVFDTGQQLFKSQFKHFQGIGQKNIHSRINY